MDGIEESYEMFVVHEGRTVNIEVWAFFDCVVSGEYFYRKILFITNITAE